MGTDRSGALAAQGLDETDLEANRAGRVSEKQLARQAEVRRSGARVVWIIAAFVVVGSNAMGAWGYFHDAAPGIAVFMAIFGLVAAALPLGIYYAFRFADPAKVGAGAVKRIEKATVGAFVPSATRGVYAISLNGRRYSGFARGLGRAQLGAHVDAYVVEEHRIVVALAPVD